MPKKPCLKVQNMQCKFLDWKWPSPHLERFWKSTCFGGVIRPLASLYHAFDNTNHIFSESSVLTQYYQVPTSPALHWPSTTKYQIVPPCTVPLPTSTTSTGLYWTSSTKHQPVPPYAEPLSPTSFLFSNFNCRTFLVCHPEMSTAVR